MACIESICSSTLPCKLQHARANSDTPLHAPFGHPHNLAVATTLLTTFPDKALVERSQQLPVASRLLCCH
jgi:hypothetical protein